MNFTKKSRYLLIKNQRKMCEKSRRKIDIATILYKAFIIIMFASQLYPLLLGVLVWQQISVHIVLMVYLAFRYYMLVRMKNRAIALDLTLTEFLNERASCRHCALRFSCEKCDLFK